MFVLPMNNIASSCHVEANLISFTRLMHAHEHNELTLRGCNTYLFLECRKRQDCYMWMGKPTGPSVKFHVTNVHTMDELRLTGNCMKGSRPIVTFDESFTRVPSMKVLKPLLIDIFGTPRGHPKSKPFVDRVITFFYADNKVRRKRRKTNLLVCMCWLLRQ